MRLLTTHDVAIRMGVTASRVRQIVAEGLLRATKVGRDLVIEEPDFETYMKGPKRGPGRPRRNPKENTCA